MADEKKVHVFDVFDLVRNYNIKVTRRIQAEGYMVDLADLQIDFKLKWEALGLPELDYTPR